MFFVCNVRKIPNTYQNLIYSIFKQKKKESDTEILVKLTVQLVIPCSIETLEKGVKYVQS